MKLSRFVHNQEPVLSSNVLLDKCQFVYMLKHDETEVLLADRSGVSDFVAKVEGFFASKGKISGYRTTVPVMEVDGLRIVEFQHLRYVYEETEQRFVPGAVALGRTYDDMQQEASGLSNTEAKHRINTIGNNSVDVEMPSLPVSVATEFLTLFYIPDHVLFRRVLLHVNAIWHPLAPFDLCSLSDPLAGCHCVGGRGILGARKLRSCVLGVGDHTRGIQKASQKRGTRRH
ncbi:hypothetical protein PHYPSEUDO_012590 [Phytophthora pseudosyringae]|uniref:Uncharacterized protein n=1 Tax=Phytophthora pseudosyringae TaxID=221518 RepID=A0A8T1W3A5_9STRA|nr:hypothetical protein PHYPSEUDO_012590 [Phytophthora pseudosyringae]